MFKLLLLKINNAKIAVFIKSKKFLKLKKASK